jgi:hypothetical protein
MLIAKTFLVSCLCARSILALLRTVVALVLVLAMLHGVQSLETRGKSLQSW